MNIAPVLFNFWRRLTSRSGAIAPNDAEIFLARDQFAQAREAFTALLDDPDLTPQQRAHLHNRRGVAAMRDGDASVAGADFEAALRCDALSAPALTNLGNLRLEAGDALAALALYDHAIAADDTYPNAHRNRGVALRRLGRLAESVRELRKANALEGRALQRPSTQR